MSDKTQHGCLGIHSWVAGLGLRESGSALSEVGLSVWSKRFCGANYETITTCIYFQTGNIRHSYIFVTRIYVTIQHLFK
jgi:hypothetical protein